MSEGNDMNLEKYYEDIELIDRFTNGSLNEDENASIKARLATDEEFRALHDDMELMIEGIRRSGIKLDNTSSDIDSDAGDEEVKIQLEGEGRPVILIWHKRMAIRTMAAVFILVVVSTLILNPFKSPAIDEVFALNFVAFESPGTVRSTGGLSSIAKAYTAYDIEDYAVAINHFEEAIAASDDNINERFYLGISYLANSNPRKSVTLFQGVIDDGDGLVVHAKWYLALSYLKRGDLDASIVLLEELKISSGRYSEKAGRVLKQLD